MGEIGSGFLRLRKWRYCKGVAKRVQVGFLGCNFPFFSPLGALPTLEFCPTVDRDLPLKINLCPVGSWCSTNICLYGVHCTLLSKHRKALYTLQLQYCPDEKAAGDVLKPELWPGVYKCVSRSCKGSCFTYTVGERFPTFCSLSLLLFHTLLSSFLS